jgi:predicted RNA binding protein YcfA (HicA-like mRNA interferase family)
MGNDIMVSESDKLLVRILRGTSDTIIPFEGMCRLLHNLGFEERTRGSHHIFTRDGVEEILKLQSSRPGQTIPGQTGEAGNPQVSPGRQRR